MTLSWHRVFHLSRYNVPWYHYWRRTTVGWALGSIHSTEDRFERNFVVSFSFERPDLFFVLSWRRILPPATKLRQGNVFTPVCQSFCSQGEGVYLWSRGGVCHTPGQTPPSGQTPPGQTAPPPGQTPQCMLGYTHTLAQCMLGYTQPPAQCMLGYSQQAGGTHPICILLF